MYIYISIILKKVRKRKVIRFTYLSFSKGQLAYGGTAVRPVSPGLGRTDLGHRPRNPDLVARQRSSRRGVTGVEEIPRRPQRCAAPATIAPRVEAASRTGESKLREAFAEEERRPAVLYYARLLLLPTILRNIRRRVLRREHSGERWYRRRSEFGRGVDRIDQVAGQRVGGVRVGKVRQKEAIDRLRMLDDRFHGDFVRLFVGRGRGISRERQRADPSDMRVDVHFRQHARLLGRPFRHGGRGVSNEGEGSVDGDDLVYQLYFQLDHGENLSGHGGRYGEARRVRIFHRDVVAGNVVRYFSPA